MVRPRQSHRPTRRASHRAPTLARRAGGRSVQHQPKLGPHPGEACRHRSLRHDEGARARARSRVARPTRLHARPPPPPPCDARQFEWASHQHRDSIASHLGHFDLLSYMAVAQVCTHSRAARAQQHHNRRARSQIPLTPVPCARPGRGRRARALPAPREDAAAVRPASGKGRRRRLVCTYRIL